MTTVLSNVSVFLPINKCWTGSRIRHGFARWEWSPSVGLLAVDVAGRVRRSDFTLAQLLGGREVRVRRVKTARIGGVR